MAEVTDPFKNLQPPRQLDLHEITAALRQDLIAELDAISLYQSHIDATDDERVKKVVAHIRDEEKEHVAEFLELIEQLDPAQAELFLADHPTAVRERRYEVFDESESAASAREADGPETVGSLLGMEQESGKELG